MDAELRGRAIRKVGAWFLCLVLAGTSVATAASPAPAPDSPGPSASTFPGGGVPESDATIRPDLFTAPADPLALDLTLGKKRSGKTIGPKGGTLKAKGAKGTTYTLTIPEGAVPVATRITMVPVTKVAGFPDGADPPNTLGVELQPSGLPLAVPATLRIDAAADPPELDSWALSTRADGTEAGFQLVSTSEGATIVQVEHFSSYFMVWPLAMSEARAVASRLQSEADARFASDVAFVLGLMRQRQLLDIGEETLGDMWPSLYARWLKDVLKPRLAAAGQGCLEAQSALTAMVGAARTMEQLGLTEGTTLESVEVMLRDADGGTLTGLIDLVTTLCFKEAYEFCRESGDFPGLVFYYSGVFARAEYLGIDPTPDHIALAQDYLSRCGRFRLKLATSWIVDDDAGHNYDEAIETSREFYLRWEPGPAGQGWGIVNGRIRGNGDVDVSKLEQKMICSTRISDISSATDAEAEVTGMTLARYELPVSRIQLRAVPPVLTRLSMRIGFGKVAYRVKRLGGCADQSDQVQTFSEQAGLVDGKFDKTDYQRAVDGEAAEAVFDSEELKNRKGVRGGWEYRTQPLRAVLALDGKLVSKGPGGTQTSRSRLEIIFEHAPE